MQSSLLLFTHSLTHLEVRLLFSLKIHLDSDGAGLTVDSEVVWCLAVTHQLVGYL